MEERVKIGQIVQDERGEKYQILCTAEHERDHGMFLIYQQLFGEFKIMARPIQTEYPEFQSAPAAAAARPQKTSAAAAESPALTGAVQKSPEAEMPEPKSPKTKSLTDLMIEFLDERDITQKQRILDEIALRPDLNDSLIDNLAAAMDVVIDEGPIDQRFADLRYCVRTRAHYELRRFR